MATHFPENQKSKLEMTDQNHENDEKPEMADEKMADEKPEMADEKPEMADEKPEMADEKGERNASPLGTAEGWLRGVASTMKQIQA